MRVIDFSTMKLVHTHIVDFITKKLK